MHFGAFQWDFRRAGLTREYTKPGADPRGAQAACSPYLPKKFEISRTIFKIGKIFVPEYSR
jgi:hypothetical protein